VTGLLEIPNARVLTENRYRLGATHVHPYRYYFGTVGIFDRIEVSGRVTQVIDVPALTAGYGDSKDKAFDAKFQLVKEGKYLPALSVVISDPTGTRIYASQSVVASKQIFPFDFTVGFGNGRLGKAQLPAQGEGFQVELITDPSKWASEALPFGGVQFSPTRWLSVTAEYSPIRYEVQTHDPAQPVYFTSPVPSHFNFGVRLTPLRWLELGASWQRGNEVGVTATVAFDIGRPLVPIHDPPYRETPEAAREPFADRIGFALFAAGFRDIGVETDGITLRVDAQNDRYFFAPRAVEVLLETIAPFVPPKVEYIRVQLKENGIPVAGATAPGPALSGARDTDDLAERLRETVEFRSSDFSAPVADSTHRRWFRYFLRPSFEMFLNDPSGYFKYRLGVVGGVETYPWKGGTAVLELGAYPLNNVSTANEPLSIPVRSDVAEYKQQNVDLSRLLFDQTVATRGPVYFRIGAGLLERMYGGVDGEFAFPLWKGRILAGASGSAVRKRDPDNPFGFIPGADYYTALALGRLNVPELDVSIDVKAGRFLAGDKGVVVSVSKFVRGVTLTAWYSATDTSIFTDPYNSGYHDKGISVEIPIRLFLGRDSRTAYRFSLSPWTRDVAQDLDRHLTLFQLIGRNAGVLLDKDRGSMYKGSE